MLFFSQFPFGKQMFLRLYHLKFLHNFLQVIIRIQERLPWYYSDADNATRNVQYIRHNYIPRNQTKREVPIFRPSHWRFDDNERLPTRRKIEQDMVGRSRNHEHTSSLASTGSDLISQHARSFSNYKLLRILSKQSFFTCMCNFGSAFQLGPNVEFGLQIQEAVLRARKQLNLHHPPKFYTKEWSFTKLLRTHLSGYI